MRCLSSLNFRYIGELGFWEWALFIQAHKVFNIFNHLIGNDWKMILSVTLPQYATWTSSFQDFVNSSEVSGASILCLFGGFHDLLDSLTIHGDPPRGLEKAQVAFDGAEASKGSYDTVVEIVPYASLSGQDKIVTLVVAGCHYCRICKGNLFEVNSCGDLVSE